MGLPSLPWALSYALATPIASTDSEGEGVALCSLENFHSGGLTKGRLQECPY